MKPAAIEHAKARLAKAKLSLAVIENHKVFEAASPQNVEDFQPVWEDFLVAVCAVYSKLEQGAKGDGKSESWYGRRKHERRKDPLLRYVHFARNCEEHGLTHSTLRDPESYGF